MKRYCFAFFTALVFSLQTYAELRSMSEVELSNATGEGLGFALEDFAFSTDDAVATVTGFENSNNEEITAEWRQFYIYGEGSQYGTELVTTDIGSYLHPWVFRTARGGSSPEYAAFEEDTALLEFKADSYTSPLQDSASFILHNRYQGCIWGHDGCGDGASPFEAVAAVDAQIAQYNAEYTDLLNTYSSVYGGQVSSSLIIEAETVQTPGGVVYEQQLVIEARQVELESAIRSYENANPGAYAAAQQTAGEEYQEAIDLYELTDQSVSLGEKYSCGLIGLSCSQEERAYNNQVDEWADAQDAVGDIEDNWKDETLALSAANSELGDILIGEDSIDETGQTLAQRIADADRFQVLCGDSATNDDCENGMISRRNGERETVNDIAVAIDSGQVRRQGMDIGSRFKFELVNENKNTGEITRVDDFLSFELRGVYLDGAYMRLWSLPDEAGLGELQGELSLRFFAKEYAISACGVECEILPDDSPETIQDKILLRDSTALKLNNYLYDLNLGYGDVQPMTFQVTSDGNFVFEMDMPDFDRTGLPRTVDNVREFFNDYYDNAPKSNFIIGQVQLGSVPESGPNYGDLGGVRAVGLRAQYLRIESFDLN